MEKIRTLYSRLLQINPFSKGVIQFATILSMGYFLCSILSSLLFPYSPNPQTSLLLTEGAIESAFATFAAGVVAALLCDLVDMDRKKKQGQ